MPAWPAPGHLTAIRVAPGGQRAIVESAPTPRVELTIEKAAEET